MDCDGPARSRSFKSSDRGLPVTAVADVVGCGDAACITDLVTAAATVTMAQIIIKISNQRVRVAGPRNQATPARRRPIVERLNGSE